MSLEDLVLCYNRGCGRQYKPSDNTERSCLFHPGEPFFHDAYKGWTCCNRKSVDFTEFLNMKGCTTACHSNVKPPEPEKQTEIVEDILEVRAAKPIVKAMPRPPVDSPMVKTPKEFSESLKGQTYEESRPTPCVELSEMAICEVPVGTVCVNNGCSEKYVNSASNEGICKYHPGVPIFHEGLKFWSCCQKRTTDFQTFLEQEGCARGSHLWVKPKEATEDSEGKKMINCRFDWHQTGSHVIVAVYGKKFDPTLSEVKTNGVKLEVELYFPEEDGFYRKQWILVGIIDPDKCVVLMTPTKIEIKMKKAEPVFWRDLAMPDVVRNYNELQQVKNVGVDPVDLDDL